MTDAREAVQRVLLQRHVIEQLRARHERDTEAAAALLDVGDKKVAALDEIPLGKVELRDGTATASVVDRPAFTAWALQAHPDWFKDEPALGPLSDAIRQLRTSEALWPAADVGALSTVVHAAEAHLLTLQRQPRNQLREGVEAALLDNVKRNGGQRVDPETGEVEDVPGVAYGKGEPKPFVTIERKKGAPELVAGMLDGGRLPAMPEIEAS